MYVCGITPYDATHLGHALTYVAYDLIVRALRDAGHDVRYTQNVTDVDDPLLVRAREVGEDWRELATREIALFREDMAALRVLPPTSFVGAVESMDLVSGTVDRLAAAGATYELDGDTYFAVSAAPALGQVAHLSRDEMVEVARERGGDPDRPGKKDPLDPLVWQAARPDEPSWPSPRGVGRPGWHVECAAIALDTLGTRIDIQGGGTDLIFPHHELGAAEAEVVTGERPFARFFVHTAMLELDGHKMSKSRGNLVFVSKLRAAGVDPGAIRLGLLSEHYRTVWEWTAATLSSAEDRLARWRRAVHRPTGPDARPLLAEVRRALADDLDAPQALRAVDHWVADAVGPGGDDPDAPGLVCDLVDALLGVALRDGS
jgi:L-cysteine:1D-myo-inositol 2-amino-2-deoxy-alpha-D-glucopyranoside ligase